jgi:hypothetical protein
MELKLIREEGDNTYCGPAAMSLLTGKPVKECVKAIKKAGNRKIVKGIYTWELVAGMKKLGFKAELQPLPRYTAPDGYQHSHKNYTLRQLLDRWWRNSETAYLVVLTHHFIVVQGRMMYDNSNPEGLPLGLYKRLRTRVKVIYSFRRTL